MTKIKEINHQIHLLFQQYGIKSLTMDDLANKLGCSKKTLYIYYENRADLVHKVISQDLDEHLREVQAVFNLNKHPIEELFLHNKLDLEKLNSIHPSSLYDLKKYYPKTWGKFDQITKKKGYEFISKNLERGVKLGVYRKEIHVEILAKILTENLKSFLIKLFLILLRSPLLLFIRNLCPTTFMELLMTLERSISKKIKKNLCPMKLINIALLCIGFLTSYSQGMSSEDLFKYALKNSPTIKNSNLDVDMADQQIKQALTSGYPKINGSLSFQNFIDIPTTVVPAAAFDPNASSDDLLGLQFGTDINANYSLQLDQLIFSFSYIYGVQTAKSYKQLTELIKLKSYDDLFYDVKIAVGNHVFITKNIAFIKENLIEVESLINRTKKLITEGFLDKNAINELEFLKLEMLSLANDLDHKLITNTYGLKSKIGYPLDSAINITNQFPSGLSKFIDFKLDEKSTREVQIVQQNLMLDEMQLKITKSEALPVISGFFNHQQMAMRNEFNLFDSQEEWFPSTLWGININIPIFNSGEGKAKTTQKEINILKTTNQLENVLREISTLLALLKNDYQTAIDRYEICEKKQQVADEIYKDELKKYELGSSQLMSLSEKKMLVIQAEQELLEKELEIYTLKSQLEKYTNPLKND